MQCPACRRSLDGTPSQCPHCQTRLHHWFEMREYAQRLAAQARADLAAGDLCAATVSLLNAVFLHPGDPETLKNLGLVLLRQGNRRDARHYLQQARKTREEEGLAEDPEIAAALAEPAPPASLPTAPREGETTPPAAE